jgi:hypothetical protein
MAEAESMAAAMESGEAADIAHGDEGEAEAP